MRDNDPITRGDLQTLFDHITSERRSVENYVDNKIEQVNTKVDALQKGVSTLQKDVSTLKTDVSTLKTDMKRVENKVDVLTDAVIEGFDNTERILSDWEGKPVDIISKQTKDELENTA